MTRYQYYKQADGEWIVRDELKDRVIIATCPNVEKACLIRDCLNDDYTQPTAHTNHNFPVRAAARGGRLTPR